MSSLKIIAVVLIFLLIGFFVTAFFVRPKWTSEQWAVTRLFAALTGGMAASLFILGSFEIKFEFKSLASSGTGGAGAFLLIWWTWIKIVPLDEINAVVEECKKTLWELVSTEDFSSLGKSAGGYVMPAIDAILREARTGSGEARAVLYSAKTTKSLKPVYEYLGRKEWSGGFTKQQRSQLAVLAYLLGDFGNAERVIAEEAAVGGADPVLAQIQASIREKQGKKEEAAAILTDSLQKGTTGDASANEERARMLMFLSHIEKPSSDCAANIARLEEAYRILSLSGSKTQEWLITCCYSLSEALAADGQAARAADYREEAKALAGITKGSASHLRHEGHEYLQRKKYTLAMQSFNGALDADAESKERQILDYEGIASVHTELSQFDQAKSALAKAMELCSETGCMPGKLGKHLKIAEVCEKQGDLAEAAKHVDEAINIGKTLPLSSLEREALEKKAEFYFKKRFGARIRAITGNS